MGMTGQQLPRLLNKLRWIIPASMAALGYGYTLFEHLVLIPGLVSPVLVLVKGFVIGTLGPVLAWLLLTWASRIAQSRRKALKSLERRAVQLETASQVGQKVAAILDLDELLAQVVKLIQDRFGYYHVHVFLVDGRSNEIVLRECSGQADEPLKIRGLRLKIGEEGITGWVAQTGEPVLCNNVSQESRYYAHELLPETRSELAIPLTIGDVVVGVLDVQSRQRDAFGNDDLITLQILGDQVAIAIENANLFQETRRQYEVMQALHDISLDITSHLESQQVLPAILEQATLLLKAQGAALPIYDPDQDVLLNVAVHNTPPEFQGVSLRVGEGVAGYVVATRKPLIINDYPHWTGQSPHFQNSPFDAVIGVPLRWQGQVIGALVVLDRGERRPFTEDDVRLLSLFADLASIALKNAELYAQVEQKVEQRTEELAKARAALAEKADQLQRLLATTVRVQEEERIRIARDLHDGSNQLITGALYEIQAVQRRLTGRGLDVALGKLKTAKELLRQIDAENRRIISDLRPPILDAQGLMPALRWQAETFQECYRIACPVRVSGQPVELPPEVETAVYRIVQEALNNVAAHARARRVQLRLNFWPGQLRVVVEDNGVGIEGNNAHRNKAGQMGLIGMRERAQSIGGRLEVQSLPGRGTRIALDVPLSAEPATDAAPA
ncbi:MAG: GAF domain-containing protein [Anaerolineae bacterium]